MLAHGAPEYQRLAHVSARLIGSLRRVAEAEPPFNHESAVIGLGSRAGILGSTPRAPV